MGHCDRSMETSTIVCFSVEFVLCMYCITIQSKLFIGSKASSDLITLQISAKTTDNKLSSFSSVVRDFYHDGLHKLLSVGEFLMCVFGCDTKRQFGYKNASSVWQKKEEANHKNTGLAGNGCGQRQRQ